MNIAEEADIHIKRIHALVETGQIVWKELPTPKPLAMRAFQGQNNDYLINVARANVIECGIVHEGMIVTGTDSPLLIRLPPADAVKLYQRASEQHEAASAQRN